MTILLQMVTLFELSIHALFELEDKSMKLKELMATTKDGEINKFSFVWMLQQNFNNLCNIYIEIVLDRDGHHSAVDQIADQVKIFIEVIELRSMA